MISNWILNREYLLQEKSRIEEQIRHFRSHLDDGVEKIHRKYIPALEDIKIFSSKLEVNLIGCKMK
jgi:hypothetical protein